LFALLLVIILIKSEKVKLLLKNDIDSNKQPVIGILSQTLETEFKNNPLFDGYNSYIMRAYVNFLESSGAQVVPLIINELD
jgi:hypothetical protein